MKLSMSLAVAASLSVFCAGVSNAATVFHYDFSADSYYDYAGSLGHSPVVGSFNFDPSTGALSNVDYTSVSGHFTTGAEYTPGVANEIFFGDIGGNYDVYQLAGSLTDGATVAITSGTHPGIVIIAGGSLVTASAVTGAVPEPASWAMMLVGFGGLGAVLRSRRRMSLPV